MSELQTVIANALLSGIARHTQPAGGVVVRIDPPFLPPRGTPTLVTGYVHLHDVAAVIAASVTAAQAAGKTTQGV